MGFGICGDKYFFYLAFMQMLNNLPGTNYYCRIFYFIKGQKQ